MRRKTVERLIRRAVAEARLDVEMAATVAWVLGPEACAPANYWNAPPRRSATNNNRMPRLARAIPNGPGENYAS